MRRRIMFFCACACLIWLNSFADTIVLKTGQKIDGVILERSNETIKIKFEGVDLGYVLSEIDFINGEKVKPSGAAVDLWAPEDMRDAGAAVPPFSNATVSDASLPRPSPQNAGFPGTQGPAAGLPAIAVGVTLVVLFVALVFYVFGAICLQFIAKKTQQELVWMAWVPVANLFLMCRIAQVRYWWLLLSLGSFIPPQIVPHMGLVCMSAFNGFIWFKIALARNKPGWIGLLSGLGLCAVIPGIGTFVIFASFVVSLAVMGYLAFSE